jgi:hypothetical protein
MNIRARGVFNFYPAHKLFRADGSGGPKQNPTPAELAVARARELYASGFIHEALFHLINTIRSSLFRSSSESASVKPCLTEALRMYREKDLPHADLHGLNIAEAQYRLGEKEAAKTLLREIVERIPLCPDLEQQDSLRMIAVELFLLMGEHQAAKNLSDGLKTEAGIFDGISSLTTHYIEQLVTGRNKGPN